MIRMIACDLDGTLVPEGSCELNPEYYDVIRSLKRKGILFIASSGRGLPSAMKLFTPVRDEVYFMVEEGGLGYYRGKTLFEEKLDPDVASRVIRFVKARWNALIMVSTESCVITDSLDEKLKSRVLDGYGMPRAQIDDLARCRVPFMKTAVYWPGEDAVNCSGLLIKEFGDEVNIIVSGQHWVDITPKTVSKGNGMRRMQKILGVTKEETVIFGDNINDIPMFSEASVSYCVRNGREEARKAATHVIDGYEKDGVLEVLKTYL